jgi:putative glutamine amidotransferase
VQDHEVLLTAPRIGISRCSRLDDYVTSIEQAGGRVRILEVSESPRALVNVLDGVLLTGGGDVDPVLYGQDRHDTVSDAEPGRDEFELDLARRALADDLPLLGICRGAQVLNVAAGGSLVQDIPSALPGSAAHQIATPADALAHPVTVTPGSALAAALAGRTECAVNSRHHQSVARAGTGLIVSAVAPDGVIEALEAPDATFCLAVQWHPENFCRSGEFASLFTAFVNAARSRRRPSPTLG